MVRFPAASAALTLALVALLVTPARATWSLVIVDSATGEVGIAGATCLEGLDLAAALPVLVIGQGGACAQSALDVGATNRKKIWEALHAGIPASEIIDIAKEGDLQKCARQYGVADIHGGFDAFTGACAQQWKGRRIGLFGTQSYAIQGNVLAGEAVVQQTKLAIQAPADNMAERLLAGMEAARAMGGDGRCSCDADTPPACGAPPQKGFDKTAHIAFMMVGRMGDIDGVCNGGVGCANGDYWLRLNVKGFGPDPDPVFTLADQYERFHQGKQNQPDGLLSLAEWDELIDDQVAQLHVSLNDIDGAALTTGGQNVSVSHAPGSAGQSPRQAVTDHGDGTYTIQVLRGPGEGVDLFEVTFTGPSGRATLFPWPELKPVSPEGRR